MCGRLFCFLVCFSRLAFFQELLPLRNKNPVDRPQPEAVKPTLPYPSVDRGGFNIVLFAEVRDCVVWFHACMYAACLQETVVWT